MNRHLNQIQNWPEMARQAGYSTSKLAKSCGVSLRTLERHFLKEMGKTPKSWLMEQRHQKAAGLLNEGKSVKETAKLLDFKHSNHLTNAFKKHWGSCPSERSASVRVRP